MSEDHNLVPARPIGNIYCGTCSWTDRTLIERRFLSGRHSLAGGAAALLCAGVPHRRGRRDLLCAAFGGQRAALGGADTAWVRVQHQGVWPVDTASDRSAPASRRRPRAAAEGRAGEGPALSRWRAGRGPRTRLDGAHRGAAAAGSGRQARLRAVPIPTLVSETAQTWIICGNCAIESRGRSPSSSVAAGGWKRSGRAAR